MIGLTAWLSLLVSNFSASVVGWLPYILTCTLGPLATVNFFHWLRGKFNNVFTQSSKGVEVYDLDKLKDYESFAKSPDTHSNRIFFANRSKYDSVVWSAIEYQEGWTFRSYEVKKRWYEDTMRSKYWNKRKTYQKSYLN